MKITLEANPSDAPCCLKLIAEDGRDLLIQTNWDLPCIASTFGWSMDSVQKAGRHCEHSGTDGTIACPECSLQAGDFIAAARQWIDDHDGAETDDPGYFDNN